jgi:hypothetical protein
MFDFLESQYSLLGNNMILRLDPSFPTIRRRDMLVQRSLLPFLRIKVLAIRSTGDSIVVPEQASRLQFRE